MDGFGVGCLLERKGTYVVKRVSRMCKKVFRRVDPVINYISCSQYLALHPYS